MTAARHSQAKTWPPVEGSPGQPAAGDVAEDACGGAASEGNSAPRWHSTQLLAGRPWAEIVHDHQVYRLQRTAAGKLILTK